MLLFQKFKGVQWFWPLLILGGSLAWSEEPHGFGKVNFGDSKELAIKNLVKKYDFKQIGNAIVGKNNTTLNNSSKAVWVENFPLGKNRRVTVWFHFNSNEKFYKYEIESASMPEKASVDSLLDIAQFLGKVFEIKFGPPAKKYELSHLNLKEGYISIYQKWQFEGSQSFIAYKLREKKVHVIAMAQNNLLEREPPVPKTQTTTSEDVEDAANAF